MRVRSMVLGLAGCAALASCSTGGVSEVTGSTARLEATVQALPGKQATWYFEYARERGQLGTAQDETTVQQVLPAGTPEKQVSAVALNLSSDQVYFYRLCGRIAGMEEDACLNTRSFRTALYEQQGATQNVPGSRTFTVPAGVSSLRIDLAGGQGGTGTRYEECSNIFCPVPSLTGGKGGRVTTTVKVTPGQVLKLNAGGAGTAAAGVGTPLTAPVSGGPGKGGASPSAPGAGGDGGTGAGSPSDSPFRGFGTGGGGGGAASSVTSGTTVLAMAGGGGGSANNGGNATVSGTGGAGGPVGGDGLLPYEYGLDAVARIGQGGGPAGNGAGGTPGGAAGAANQGGAGGSDVRFDPITAESYAAGDQLAYNGEGGGGGGGGCFAGGGGSSGIFVLDFGTGAGPARGSTGGGGGGSSCANGNRAIYESGTQEGDGYVLISYAAAPAS